MRARDARSSEMSRFTLALLVLFGMSFIVLAQTTAPPARDVSERLVSFDCDRTEVAWAEQHWQLQAAGILLKDFGRREHEARQALRLVRQLRLNQYGAIGSPSPALEYWL